MIKNIRFRTLVLALLAIAATPFASPVMQTTNIKKNATSPEQTIINNLNNWLSSPQPTSAIWRSNVQRSITTLRTTYNNTNVANQFQGRYNTAIVPK